MTTQARIERAQLLMLDAMVDPARWDAALLSYAEACGGHVGQLLSLDGDRLPTGHWLVGVPEDFGQKIIDYDLGAPEVNPRFRMGLEAQLLRPAADQDYLTAEERRTHPVYNELYDPYDLSYSSLVVLKRDEEALIRASITRSRKQGPLDQAAFRAFNKLTPHLHAAVRAQLALQRAQGAAALQSLEAVRQAAFLLNDFGRVVGMTSAAEALLSACAVLQIIGGKLRFRTPPDQAAFDAALGPLMRALGFGAVIAPGPIQLASAPIVVELQMLPRHRLGLASGPAMIVILREARAGERASAVRSAYGLTAAEAEIALALAEGQRLQHIAARRDVKLETVRSQLRAIFGKMNVRRQAELVARLRRFGFGEQ
ncbi:MAG TPA: helix-turn-helix transcriptional regulator [Terricaulis sp.]|nr:helix-turn-helix transcriptional regulator [Terricaulis sp.]